MKSEKPKKKPRGILGVNIMVANDRFQRTGQNRSERKNRYHLFRGRTASGFTRILEKGNENKAGAHRLLRQGPPKFSAKKWLSKFDYLPDAFVVEGPKAGGHLGFRPEQLDDPKFALENLVRDVIETVKDFTNTSTKSIPVIAAGGVFTGEDIHKFLEMGAAGVQMGTRFVGHPRM